MHSLVASCVCPDREYIPRPSCTRTTLQPTEPPSQGHPPHVDFQGWAGTREQTEGRQGAGLQAHPSSVPAFGLSQPQTQCELPGEQDNIPCSHTQARAEASRRGGKECRGLAPASLSPVPLLQGDLWERAAPASVRVRVSACAPESSCVFVHSSVPYVEEEQSRAEAGREAWQLADCPTPQGEAGAWVSSGLLPAPGGRAAGWQEGLELAQEAANDQPAVFAGPASRHWPQAQGGSGAGSRGRWPLWSSQSG